MNVLIVGCGYLGLRCADRWLATGANVAALTRSPGRAAEMRGRGIDPFVGDVQEAESLRGRPASDVRLYAVGYDRGSGASKQAVYVDGLRNVLHAVRGRAGRIIYVSSSSVYGQESGEWIDENSPTEPRTEGGRICLDAEQLLAREADAQSLPWCTLRLTGLYGPGRVLAIVYDLRRRAPLAGSGDAWLNLIQIEDAAMAVTEVAASRPRERLYLVTDDQPVQRREYYAQLAELVGAPPPEFDPERAPRHGTGLNKRCLNRRFKREFGIAWRYPTIETGLPAALATGSARD